MENVTKVGFIGLGTMGKPMVLNLLKAGFAVNGYDLFPEKVAEVTDAGGTLLNSPAEVAKNSQVVLTMVNDCPNLEQILFGKNGCHTSLHDDLIFIDSSTIAPNDIRRIYGRLSKLGHEFIDAPVSGGAKGAIEGTLTIMAGGSEKAFQRVLPILEAMGSRVTYMGLPGSGQVTKLCNQIMLGINTLGVSEALMLASREGLDLDKLLEALVVGAGTSRMLVNYGAKMSNNDFSGKFPIRLIQKDFRLVNQTLVEDSLSLPGTALVLQLYNSVAASDPMIGHEGLLVALEKLNGFEVGKFNS